MFQKVKKGLAIMVIIILLPYILTMFINGRETNQQDLLKQHCITVLAKEVSPDYEEELLKAQSIIVRTTVYQQIQEEGSDYKKQKDFGEIKNIDKSWYKRLEKIWDATEGQVILFQGELALVPFHQVSNGKTRDGIEALGDEKYSYLKIRECPLDVEAERQMQSKFIEVKNAKVIAYDQAGYVLSVQVGGETMNGENFRDKYSLVSSCFELQEFQENTRVITKGIGHGLGLSQYTANEMAKAGQGYKEILSFFYEGIEIQEVAEILWNLE